MSEMVDKMKETLRLYPWVETALKALIGATDPASLRLRCELQKWLTARMVG